jgi:hypothetical protein
LSAPNVSDDPPLYTVSQLTTGLRTGQSSS